MAAAISHYVSPERLAFISKSIPKVLIITGDEDNLVNPNNSRHMKACMPEAELIEWKRTGHGIHGQWRDRFNATLEHVFNEGRQRVHEGFTSN